MSYADLIARNGFVFPAQDAGEWRPHPQFAGVHLLPLLSSGKFPGYSALLVRVEAGSAIGTHIHEREHEVHQVLKGSGQCRLPDQRLDYRPGCLAIIPAAVPHSVLAGQELLLLASFMAESSDRAKSGPA